MQRLTIPITEVKPNPKNPRTISAAKLDKLAQSIQEFPRMMVIRPIVVDESGTVLGGNQRLEALKKLGYQEIPREWIRRESELSAAEKKRFIAVDNLPYGEWDRGALAGQYDKKEMFDWGFDDNDIDNAFDVLKDGNTPEDEVPDAPKEPKCKTGDLWVMGEHRLLCGDSADRDIVTRALCSALATCVFTDPPYGVSIGKKNRMLNTFQKSGRNLTDIEDDDLSPEELKKRLLPIFNNTRELAMAEDCSLFVTAPQGGELGMMMMMMMMQEACLRPRHVLIWKKNSPTFSMGRLDYDYAHEPILLTWLKKHKRPMRGKFKTSVWEIDKPRACKEHPTMKPVELYENAYLNNSDGGDIVFDPFAGSGTAAIAAEKTGRHARLIEISPVYCDVILTRWAKFTGADPVREDGAKWSTLNG